MAVRIRLFRRGRKKMAMYDIVVADARAPRDGKFIEKLGNYNPNMIHVRIDNALTFNLTNDINLNKEKASLKKWPGLFKPSLKWEITSNEI